MRCSAARRRPLSSPRTSETAAKTPRASATAIPAATAWLPASYAAAKPSAAMSSIMASSAPNVVFFFTRTRCYAGSAAAPALPSQPDVF